MHHVYNDRDLDDLPHRRDPGRYPGRGEALDGQAVRSVHRIGLKHPHMSFHCSARATQQSHWFLLVERSLKAASNFLIFPGLLSTDARLRRMRLLTEIRPLAGIRPTSSWP